MATIDHLFVVGAGFSANAGLPLTSKFTEALLNIKGFSPKGPSASIVKYLRKFVSDTFAHNETAEATSWPELEDIFTCIDLSANTGHHLGNRYSPSELRTVRRALIVRTIRMLRQTYRPDAKTVHSKQLESFFSLINASHSAFLSMNWDTVIEEGLQTTQNIFNFDYGCEAVRAKFSGGRIETVDRSVPRTISILKPHGSTNWLYCDSCRQLFWFSPSSTYRIANQLFKTTDWDTLAKSTKQTYERQTTNRSCPRCNARALGTRFATFSYRKALDFPMHARTWLSAETRLREAKTWIFIGYSLPAADYEFKHLLKRVQLSRPTPPNLVLITGGDGADGTRRNYEKFFGPQFEAGHTYFSKSLTEAALQALMKKGALKSRALGLKPK